MLMTFSIVLCHLSMVVICVKGYDGVVILTKPPFDGPRIIYSVAKTIK